MPRVLNLVPCLIAVLFLSGCDSSHPNEWPAYENVIPQENRAAAAAWILECVKNANPHSDEEPEDNIAQAERTAKTLFGKPTLGMRTARNQHWVFVPLEDLPPEKQTICQAWSKGN